jgi:hypothetical protein|tara:strand:- start:555 stop:719 length:165 start_codon:yes stop_codon:yes gene_type:complete
MNATYKDLFPDVSFTDKIVVVFADGSEETFKHLYMSEEDLEEIDWSKVIECYEC